MGYKCPHCSEDIADAMSVSSHRDRLKAKDDENKSLKAELSEAQKGSKSVAAITKERDDLKAELSKRDAEKERNEAFAEVGIPDKVRTGFEAIYASYVAGLDEGEEAPSFKAWLASEDAKTHPLLAGHYTASAGEDQEDPAAPPAKQPAKKQQQTKTGLKNIDKSAKVPDAKGNTIDTPAKLRAYLQSPEYRALKKEDQKAELASLQAQLASAVAPTDGAG